MTFTPATIAGSILDFLDGVQSARVTGTRLEGGVSDGDDARLGGLDVQYSSTKTTPEPVVATGTYAIVIERLAGGQPFKKRTFTAPIAGDTSWGALLAYDGTGYEWTPDEVARLVAVETTVEGLSIGTVADATTTVKGKVELATNAEATTGTDTTRAVTPAGLAAALAGLSNYDDTALLAAIADLTSRVEAVEEGGGGTPVDPGDTTPPSVPANLDYDADASSVTITWDASTPHGEKFIDSYDVRLDGGTVHNVLAGVPFPRTWTFTGLAAASDHEAEVRALDNNGIASAWASLDVSTTGGLPEDTALRYNFNEGTGLTAAEADGKTPLSFTIDYGTAWAAGHTGNARTATLNDGDGVAVLPATLDTTTWTGITVMVWLDLGSGKAPEVVLTAGDQVRATDWPVFNLKRLGTYGTVTGFTSGLTLATHGPYDVSHTHTSTLSSSLVNAGFHHYAFTWDATTGEWKNYLDGVLLSTQTQAGTLRSNSDRAPRGLGSLRLAGRDDSDGGYRDDLRIFPRPMDATEVAHWRDTPVVNA